MVTSTHPSRKLLGTTLLQGQTCAEGRNFNDRSRFYFVHGLFVDLNIMRIVAKLLAFLYII